MMSKILFAAFVVALCLSGSEALKCNLCTGTTTSDCARNVPSAMGVERCQVFNKNLGFSTLPKLSAILRADITAECFVIKLTDNDNSSEVIQRGCGYTYPTEDMCKTMQTQYDFIVECKSCDSDLCN